jgi:hypothetical protein
MDANVAVLEVLIGAGVAFIITWALDMVECRASNPKYPTEK